MSYTRKTSYFGTDFWSDWSPWEWGRGLDLTFEPLPRCHRDWVLFTSKLRVVRSMDPLTPKFFNSILSIPYFRWENFHVLTPFSVLSIDLSRSFSQRMVLWSDSSSGRVRLVYKPSFSNFHLSPPYVWDSTSHSFDSRGVPQWFLVLSKVRVSPRIPTRLNLSLFHWVRVTTSDVWSS